MAIAFTHRVATYSTANSQSSYVSGAFTPATNDLLVVCVLGGWSTTPSDPAYTLTSSTGLTFTRVGSVIPDTNRWFAVYVANALVSNTSSQTVTFANVSGTTSICIIDVCSVSGMTQYGSSAVYQYGHKLRDTSTPTCVFSNSVTTTNPVLGFLAAAQSSGSPMTEPSGWSELQETFGSSPTSSLEYVGKTSGFTSNTLTWGNTNSSNWATLAIEFDSSAGAASQSLTAPLYDESVDTFYTPVVATGAVTLSPTLITSGNAFYVPTMVRGARVLAPQLLGSGNVFYVSAIVLGTTVVSPPIIVSGNAFYTQAIERGAVVLLPASVGSGNSFYVPSIVLGTVVLSPLPIDSEDAFFSPSVACGSVTLLPITADSSNEFYVPSIIQFGGSQTLLANLVGSDNQFYATTIGTGAILLLPSELVNDNIFYAVTINTTVTLLADRYGNDQSFEIADINVGLVALFPSLYENQSTVYAATIVESGGLYPSLIDNQNQFYDATITAGAVSLHPDVVADSNAFHDATLTASIELAAPLMNSISEIYDASVTSTVSLATDLVSNEQTFYQHTIVAAGTWQTLIPDLFAQDNWFGIADVTGGAIALSPDVIAESNEFYDATIIAASTQELLPDLFSNDNWFGISSISGGEPQVVVVGQVSYANEYRAPVYHHVDYLMTSRFVNENVFFRHHVDINFDNQNTLALLLMAA